MANLEVLKIKLARRQILEGLNMMYPTPLRLETVYRVGCGMDPSYDWTLFEKDVHYLKDKGYLGFVDDLAGIRQAFAKKVVKLTAKGKDIADRTMSDPTLEV